MLETNEERRGGHFSPHGGFHTPEVLFEFFLSQIRFLTWRIGNYLSPENFGCVKTQRTWSSPIRFCNVLMTPPPPIGSQFSIPPHWQSVFYTPLIGSQFSIPPYWESIFYNPRFVLCWRRLIPLQSLWEPRDSPKSSIPSTQAVDNGWSLRKKKLKKLQNLERSPRTHYILEEIMYENLSTWLGITVWKNLMYFWPLHVWRAWRTHISHSRDFTTTM